MIDIESFNSPEKTSNSCETGICKGNRCVLDMQLYLLKLNRSLNVNPYFAQGYQKS